MCKLHGNAIHRDQCIKVTILSFSIRGYTRQTEHHAEKRCEDDDTVLWQIDRQTRTKWYVLCFGFPSETREPECIDSARSRKLYCQVHDPSEKHAAQNSSQVILSANGLIEWLIGFLFSTPVPKEFLWWKYKARQAVAGIYPRRFFGQNGYNKRLMRTAAGIGCLLSR